MLLKLAILICFISASFCLLLIIISKKNNSLLDQVHGIQKVHRQSVARVGGIGIFFSFLIGINVLSIKNNNPSYIYLLVSLLPIVLIGFYEDIKKKVGPICRLDISFLSALLAVMLLGSLIERTGITVLDFLVRSKIVGATFACIAIAGVTNAINIIDGMNGLSSGTSIVLFAAIGYIAFKFQDFFILSVVVVTAAAILGFFIWNYPYGRIFLGDGGAYFIGFVLAVSSILLVNRNNQVSPWFPILILIYPAFETLFTIYRRKYLKKRSPVYPDNLHLHSLFYRRVVPVIFNNGHNVVTQNAMTSPLIWGLSVISVVPAVIFVDNTFALILFTILFVLLYIFLYKSIVCFKIGHLIKRTVNSKSAS